MAKEITVVYPAHPGERVVHYEGPEGKVWLSNSRASGMPNVFCSWHSCPHPEPGDSIYLMEPVVVHTQDYDVNFLDRFHKIFGCFSRCFEGAKIQHKCVTVNYGSTLQPENADALKAKWKAWNDRINGVVIVSSCKTSGHQCSTYHLREDLAQFFYKNGYQVAWFGGIPNSKHQSYFKGFLQDKIGEIAKYKFHVCTENTYDVRHSYNYMTEKLPHGIEGGAVPLYMGCYNIEELVPSDCYFDLRPFVDQNKKLKEDLLLQAIKRYSKEDFEKYQVSAYNFMKDPNGLFYHTDMRRAYKKMLEVL